MAGILDGLFQPGAAFGTNSPETQSQAPRGFLDNLISGLARSIYAGVRAPGDALASQTPITSDQMIAPAANMAGMVTLGAGAMPAEADALNMGIRGYHGSPRVDLSSISAAPAARQFDNATSQFGAFFAPKAEGAERYAGKSGRVYSADVPIEKPYEMPWHEFNYLQSPQKGPDGRSLPGDQWAARADELKQEATQMRDRLKAAGHDGIVVRKGNGDIYEMASFGDVPVDK